MALPYLLALSLLISIFSCNSAGKHGKRTDIPAAPVQEQCSRLDLSQEKIDKLSGKLDTIELTYYFGFCDCQRWITTSIHKQAAGEHADLDKPDARGQVEFNLDKHGYYIEAADKDLELDERISVNGTTVRFIGRHYSDRRLPENGNFTVPDPPAGKVFRYYSYEILRPYQMIELKYEGRDEETGDSIIVPTIKTVKGRRK